VLRKPYFLIEDESDRIGLVVPDAELFDYFDDDLRARTGVRCAETF
jgi:hypothetical protein